MDPKKQRQYLDCHAGCGQSIQELAGVRLLESLQDVRGRAAKPASEALLHLGAKSLQCSTTALLFLFKQPQSITHHFTGAGVTASTHLVADELLTVGADGVTRRHGESINLKACYLALIIPHISEAAYGLTGGEGQSTETIKSRW